ncbi:MAG: J domain-containing protein [Chlamydiales bacterium]|nr:J domain-containing protein [Chlamydiales bacterium]
MSNNQLILRQTSPFHYLPFLSRGGASNESGLKWQQTAPINTGENLIRLPATSPFSLYWEDSNRVCNRRSVGIYIIGMVGFTLALVWRVIRLAGRVLLLIAASAIALLTGKWNHCRDRAVICAITLAKIFSAIIGILCPPAAYKIERGLDRWIPDCDETLYFVLYDPSSLSVEEAYTIFELPLNSSRAEVKARHRDLALQYHPDKGRAENTATFQLIQEAYDRLDAHLSE